MQQVSFWGEFRGSWLAAAGNYGDFICSLQIAFRTILLAWLIAALGHTFIIEQPGGSSMGNMPRFRKFVEEVLYAAGLHVLDYRLHVLHITVC